MNNAMLAKEWRKAPLTRTMDLRANPRAQPAHLVKPFELKGAPTAWSRSSMQHALVVVADCVTTIPHCVSSRAPALLKRVPVSLFSEDRPLGPRPRYANPSPYRTE
jgi:hypothetical protein